jgi:formate dehydrogenase major subunit
MDRVAELVKKTRDETFIEKLPNGKLVNMTTRDLRAWRRHARDRVQSPLPETHARSGIVAIENQARI